MAVQTEKRRVTAEVVVAVTCDICGKEIDPRMHTFKLKHTFGYDSPADMTSVEAEICDHCLHKLVTEAIPHARLTDHLNGR
jgi:hypothetical protein